MTELKQFAARCFSDDVLEASLAALQKERALANRIEALHAASRITSGLLASSGGFAAIFSEENGTELTIALAKQFEKYLEGEE